MASPPEGHCVQRLRLPASDIATHHACSQPGNFASRCKRQAAAEGALPSFAWMDCEGRCGKAAGGPSRRLKIEPLRAAAQRVPCDARACGPPRNSLHSLRSFRSDSRGESVHEARHSARDRRRCASRASRYSPPRRPARILATTSVVCVAPRTSSHRARPRDGLGRGWGESGGSREAQGDRPRAEWRASCSDSRRLSEHSERSERSEFRRGPVDRASQGTWRAAPCKADRLSPSPCPARPSALLHGLCSQSTNDRYAPQPAGQALSLYPRRSNSRHTPATMTKAVPTTPRLSHGDTSLWPKKPRRKPSIM